MRPRYLPLAAMAALLGLEAPAVSSGPSALEKRHRKRHRRPLSGANSHGEYCYGYKAGHFKSQVEFDRAVADLRNAKGPQEQHRARRRLLAMEASA